MPLPALRRALAALLVAAPLVAQDTTSRGVRIGLTYDPGSKPGVVVLPVSGARGDSIRAIVQRDLDYGDRVNAMQAPAITSETMPVRGRTDFVRSSVAKLMAPTTAKSPS